ncbi:LysR substrate-binding domain-containing protein [Salinisphaera sp. T31B1]|uniref:LysR substrate-binding domain-containing protein n=1 Tax=Salinisphaera sp. T31B1 TaxID=727963 RepID=UPI0033425C73
MKLQQLRHFLAIVETGTLSLAAQRCYISQPSMSASLKKLESDIGKALFVRHAQGLTPTPTGRELQHHAARILQAVETARISLDAEPAELTGELHIGVTETISAYLLPRVLRWRRTMLPGLCLQVTEDSIEGLQNRAAEGRIDLGLMVTDNLSPTSALHCDVLFTSPRHLWLCAGHPLRQAARVRLSDVAAHPFVLLEMDEHVRTWERYWRAADMTPEIVFRSHSVEAVRSMVGQNDGVTILSDMVFRPWTLDGDHLSRRRLDDNVPGMDIGVIHAGAPSALRQAFVTMLRHNLKREAMLDQPG